MNPITKKIKEREEEFEKIDAEYEHKLSVFGRNKNVSFCDIPLQQIKSHISTTNKELLESVIEMVEGMKINNEFADNDARKAQFPRTAEMLGRQAGYNTALQYLITKLKKALKDQQ